MIWPAVAGAIGFCIALCLLLLHLIMGSREAVIQRLSQVSKTIQWFMVEVGFLENDEVSCYK